MARRGSEKDRRGGKVGRRLLGVVLAAALVAGGAGCGRPVESPVGTPLTLADLTIVPTHFRMTTLDNQEVAVIFLRIDGLPDDFLTRQGKEAARWAAGKGFPGVELRVYDDSGKKRQAIAVPEELYDAMLSHEAGNRELAAQRAGNAMLNMTALGTGMPRDWVLVADLPNATPDFALYLKNLERRKGQPPAVLVIFKKR